MEGVERSTAVEVPSRSVGNAQKPPLIIESRLDLGESYLLHISGDWRSVGRRGFTN